MKVCGAQDSGEEGGLLRAGVGGHPPWNGTHFSQNCYFVAAWGRRPHVPAENVRSWGAPWHYGGPQPGAEADLHIHVNIPT